RTVMGIYDRDYARRDAPAGSRPFVESGSAMRWLLGINIGVFILQLFTTSTQGRHAAPDPYSFTNFFLLDTPRAWHGEVWRLLTYGFLHSTDFPLHIVFNMLALWFTGRAIEERLGTREFLVFYLLGIVVAGGAFLLTNWGGGFALGASGGVSAVLVLY